VRGFWCAIQSCSCECCFCNPAACRGLPSLGSLPFLDAAASSLPKVKCPRLLCRFRRPFACRASCAHSVTTLGRSIRRCTQRWWLAVGGTLSLVRGSPPHAHAQDNPILLLSTQRSALKGFRRWRKWLRRRGFPFPNTQSTRTPSPPLVLRPLALLLMRELGSGKVADYWDVLLVSGLTCLSRWFCSSAVLLGSAFSQSYASED
jgi:hypothetical protein